jgi:hypothetical protein
MTRSASTAMALLAGEVALREAETPSALAAPVLTTPLFSFADDAFLLTLPNGLRFHYRKGQGVSFSRPAGLADAEVTLFHGGSVHGAVAWLNGLVPLHASAVVHDGRLFAFTGESGAGKSTLAAALSSHGLPLFADDVLVVDLADPARPMALPGHKKLKLWGDALAITGLDAGAAVRPDMDKYFVEPPLLEQAAPLPLHSLVFLDRPSGADPSLTPVSGAKRFSRMRSAFYRPRYAGAVVSPVDLYAMATRLGMQIEQHVFDRPRDRDRFDGNIAFLAAAIRAGNG